MWQRAEGDSSRVKLEDVPSPTTCPEPWNGTFWLDAAGADYSADVVAKAKQINLFGMLE